MEITSRSNAFLSHLRKLLRSSSYRKEQGCYVGDGLKLLQAGVESGVSFSHVVLTTGQEMPDLPEGVKVVFVPPSIMEWLSPMKTPQGALFVAPIPDCAVPTTLPQGQYLLLDGVQDPGNVGTIWRTVQGLGISGLILLEGCASPWNAKTVRSSMGACYYVPIWSMTTTEVVALCKENNLPLYGTCLEKESVALSSVSFQAPCAVVLGSEGRGISEALLQCCEKKLYLPMAQGCESLNVATMASIVAWEMVRVAP